MGIDSAGVTLRQTHQYWIAGEPGVEVQTGRFVFRCRRHVAAGDLTFQPALEQILPQPGDFPIDWSPTHYTQYVIDNGLADDVEGAVNRHMYVEARHDAVQYRIGVDVTLFDNTALAAQAYEAQGWIHNRLWYLDSMALRSTASRFVADCSSRGSWGCRHMSLHERLLVIVTMNVDHRERPEDDVFVDSMQVVIDLIESNVAGFSHEEDKERRRLLK